MPKKKTANKKAAKPLIKTTSVNACCSCAYFRQRTTNKGICHRFPPLPGSPFQPIVTESGWCGEFKPAN